MSGLPSSKPSTDAQRTLVAIVAALPLAAAAMAACLVALEYATRNVTL